MKRHIYSLLVLLSTAIICAELASAELLDIERPTSLEDVHNLKEAGENAALPRDKRTLLLKKKILGAGIVGFGLGAGIGAIKGYSYGRGGYGGYGGYGNGYRGYGTGYNGYGSGYNGYYGNTGYNGYYGNSGYNGYYGNSGGYGAFRPSYYKKWNSYVNNNQGYNQSPYYPSRPSYEYGYPPNQGQWNSYGSSYYPTNNQGNNGWIAGGTVGPLTGSLYATTSLTGSNAYNYNNNGGYYY